MLHTVLSDPAVVGPGVDHEGGPQMELRRLGRLGHESSVLIYGAAALAEVDQDTADRSIQEALDGGINHFDVAASYGEAELRLGPWMPEMRDRIFLATKTDERRRDAAWAQINSSLERLQTDHLDLLQLHAVCDLAELDLATVSGGALEGAMRAQGEGLVAAIGITGHGPQAPATHLEALRRFPFATVLTPLNQTLLESEAFRNDYESLVKEVRRQDAGLMTIKAVARRNWPDVGAGEPASGQAYATWYEPYDSQERIRAAVSWVLAHQEITGLTTAGDVRLLGMILRAERERMTLEDATTALQTDADHASPFLRMPFI
jgi:aryl-alcohol dehydrogenase-like predicted oxidoreductase